MTAWPPLLVLTMRTFFFLPSDEAAVIERLGEEEEKRGSGERRRRGDVEERERKEERERVEGNDEDGMKELEWR